MHGMQLYDEDGQRKYLTPGERDAFLKAAEDAPREVRTFCATLVYTGCRITEALELTADRVDLKGGLLVLESLKKRKRGVLQGSAGSARVLGHAEPRAQSASCQKAEGPR